MSWAWWSGPAEAALLLHVAGASWLENLNTNTTVDLTSGNVQKRLRVQIDNDGGKATTPAFKWRYSKNSGAYADITTGSSNIQISGSTHFADGDDLAELLIGATQGLNNNNAAVDATDGTFTLGENFLASNDIEAEFCFNLIAADLANADTLDIRLYLSDGTALATYTVTPRITISKSAGGPVTGLPLHHIGEGMGDTGEGARLPQTLHTIEQGVAMELDLAA